MKIVECPRDAWQGMKDFIPTEKKSAYINQLLKVGFDTIDFGSFVNPAVMPQMKDTSELVSLIEHENSPTSLLAIVANVRGAEEAVKFPMVEYLGFPLSLSETFQQRNTNKSIPEAIEAVRRIQEICVNENRTLVIYLSMGFGNPYGDPFDSSVVLEFCKRMDDLDIRILSLADTVGVSTTEMISELFSVLIPAYPHIEFGAHLHSNPATAREKIEAARGSGCQRFDGAINGFGGCPMADDDLVGNIATEVLLDVLDDLDGSMNREEFEKAVQMSLEIFH